MNTKEVGKYIKKSIGDVLNKFETIKTIKNVL